MSDTATDSILNQIIRASFDTRASDALAALGGSKPLTSWDSLGNRDKEYSTYQRERRGMIAALALLRETFGVFSPQFQAGLQTVIDEVSLEAPTDNNSDGEILREIVAIENAWNIPGKLAGGEIASLMERRRVVIAKVRKIVESDEKPLTP